MPTAVARRLMSNGLHTHDSSRASCSHYACLHACMHVLDSQFCPMSQTLRLKSGRSTARAYWTTPTARFHSSFEFTVSSSHRSGDGFRAGVTEVFYTAATDGPTGATVVECSFFITVDEACDTECCGRSDGDYPRDGVSHPMLFSAPLDRFDVLYHQRSSVTCMAGRSVCDQPLAFLPTRILSAPPHPPKFFPGPASATHAATTTVARTTTRVAATTTQAATTQAATTQAATTTKPATTPAATTTKAATTQAATTTRAATTTKAATTTQVATTTRAPTTTCVSRTCRCKPEAFIITIQLNNGCTDCFCSAEPPAATTTRTSTTTRAASTTGTASTGQAVFAELCAGKVRQPRGFRLGFLASFCCNVAIFCPPGS